MLLGQVNAAVGATERPGSRFGAWAMSQAAPMLMKRADGRVLVWTWKAEPELVVAMATAQVLTPDVRIAERRCRKKGTTTTRVPFPTLFSFAPTLLLP